MFPQGRTPRPPTLEQALRGRRAPTYSIPERHRVLGNPLLGPCPEGMEIADFGPGCFWGAGRKFSQLPTGVPTILAGYQGGFTEHPTYEEVCSGLTGHAEAVRVVHNSAVIPYESLLKLFRESHDPTPAATAESSRTAYQKVLTGSSYGTIATEILPAEGRTFHPAEGYHQEYLSGSKNPDGCCGLGGTGVSCPVGVAQADG